MFASTRQLYGKPDYLPVDEKHPIRPVDVNGINKLAGEWYHLLYNNVYGIRACALRLAQAGAPGAWLEQVLCAYRVHPGGASHRQGGGSGDSQVFGARTTDRGE